MIVLLQKILFAVHCLFNLHYNWQTISLEWKWKQRDREGGRFLESYSTMTFFQEAAGQSSVKLWTHCGKMKPCLSPTPLFWLTSGRLRRHGSLPSPLAGWWSADVRSLCSASLPHLGVEDTRLQEAGLHSLPNTWRFTTWVINRQWIIH